MYRLRRLCVYYESIKREPNKRLIFECRCDGRLKVKDGVDVVVVVYFHQNKKKAKTKERKSVTLNL